MSRRRTSTPSRPSRSRGSRATSTSSAASARSSAGTRSRWSTGRTTASTASAATSPRTRRPPRSTRSASTTSSGARATAASATRCSSRATPRPGIYARAFLEGRLTEEHLDRFRREVVGARAARATRTRAACPTSGSSRRCRWASARSTRSRRPGSTATCCTTRSPTPARRRCGAFVGDGEMDEPEAMAGLSIAARENLDNLIFVVNCNLQRLDGPVRGNGKIIQELEAIVPRRGLERHQGHLGSGVGRAARPRRRRRARQQDEHDRRRRVPEVRGRVRRVHPRALLRSRPAAAARWSST